MLKAVGLHMNTDPPCYSIQDKLLGLQFPIAVITGDFRKNVVWENRYQVLMFCWSNRQVTILDSQMIGGVKESGDINHCLWF